MTSPVLHRKHGRQTKATPRIGTRSDHIDVAKRFSDPAFRDERFVGDNWLADESGVPVLSDAQASFVCRLVEKVNFGTHMICIGEVERIRCSETDGPLIYFDGAYRDLQ
jgi:flavin reductase (DIM6/NTAB) family NADH-FMN oxidoreductase RutF